MMRVVIPLLCLVTLMAEEQGEHTQSVSNTPTNTPTTAVLTLALGETGSVTLAAETPQQRVPIRITGARGVRLAGADILMVIGQGTQGPIISALECDAGTIWAGNGDAVVPELTAHRVYGSVITRTGTVDANGVLAYLIVDTRGVPAGTYTVTLEEVNDGVVFATTLLDEQVEQVPWRWMAPGVLIVPASVPEEAVVTIAATAASAAEPSDAGSFTIARTGPTTAALTVHLTVSGTATAGSDYTAFGTSVTIPSGQASTTLTVAPIDDTAVEDPETVIVTLVAGTGYTVGTPASATVTIADNDPPVITITAADASAAEPSDAGSFTIARTGPTTAALTVNVTVLGSAIAGSDYTALGTSVTIPAGQTSTTLTVAPIDDTAVEGAETVIVTLVAGTGYAVGTPASATVTIADNDSAAGSDGSSSGGSGGGGGCGSGLMLAMLAVGWLLGLRRRL